MPVNPKGPPYKPGPSIRGRAIFSTFRGVPYVRPWPKPMPLKEGTPRAKAAEAFAAANRAIKITDGNFYAEQWKITQGTPMLPRDIMLAAMYGRAYTLVMPDGQEIWSMRARADVSSSLDVLGSTQGKMLVRGERYWEPADVPAGAGAWALTDDITISGSPTEYIFDVQGNHDFFILARDVTFALSQTRNLYLSTDGGATYWNTSPDYFSISVGGAHTGQNRIMLQHLNETGPKSGTGHLMGLDIQGPDKIIHTPTFPRAITVFQASEDPITHVKFAGHSGVAMTGGRLRVWRK